ncbi:hypothetical protein TcCL_NonESM09330, partial [Trypanosoma cruzi]
SAAAACFVVGVVRALLTLLLWVTQGFFLSHMFFEGCDNSAMACASGGLPRMMRGAVCGPHGALELQLQVAVRGAGGCADVLPGTGALRGGRAGARFASI